MLQYQQQIHKKKIALSKIYFRGIPLNLGVYWLKTTYTLRNLVSVDQSKIPISAYLPPRHLPLGRPHSKEKKKSPCFLKHALTPSSVSKFVNHLMINGKKGVAVGLLANSLLLFLKRLREERPMLFFPASVDEKLLPMPNLIPLSSCVDKGEIKSHPETLLSKKQISFKSKNKRSREIYGQTALQSNKYQRYKERFNNFKGDNLDTVSQILKELSNCFWQRNKLPSFPYLCNTNCKHPVNSPSLLKSTADSHFQIASSIAQKMKNPLFKTLEPHASARLFRFSLNRQKLFLAKRCSIRSDNTSSFSSIISNKGLSFTAPVHKSLSKKEFSISLSLLNCLEFALRNVEPSLEVRKKKIAGVTRQIPCIVPKPRGEGLAIRWIIDSARQRKQKGDKNFYECLAEELISAYCKRGEPRQKRDSLHKIAESNRSFLRYRWW